VHRLPREVLRKRDRHRTSTKFRLGVKRWVHDLFKRPSCIWYTQRFGNCSTPVFRWLVFITLTNFMEQRLSWYADSRLAGQPPPPTSPIYETQSFITAFTRTCQWFCFKVHYNRSKLLSSKRYLRLLPPVPEEMRCESASDQLPASSMEV
jgi:hypothetical protein